MSHLSRPHLSRDVYSWLSDCRCSVSPALGDRHKKSSKEGPFVLVFVLITGFFSSWNYSVDNVITVLYATNELSSTKKT